MKFHPMPPIERVRQVLSYCPESGLFNWNITLSNRAKVGSKAGAKMFTHHGIKPTSSEGGA